ncbi:DUF4440 domain-containing protein [Pseudomonas agarici]|uniref:DUF4440 domain-containing protein n=1 Tax=Pseudomonas agarici TaxID=46677 RepID=A0A0X1T7G2_PSEAA|nr:nuclear transport factor 2 family protein [Pseudomonas agarici]AMB88060.1 DUF4440 domain-containing protein [Pseudomonas agarici]NWB92944.1 nuclear transport factor 2 family protein [Pseudomonas agarici]NWC09211.1 nuclear transport factor 2 family protein [Pseudomonas agarici]SEK31577.1 protein of unknown function [Pseudomonas agarici]
MSDMSKIDSIIRELENKRYRAMVARDFVGLSKLMHSELSYAHSSGSVDSLSSYLRKCEAGFYIYHHIEHPIDSIIIIDNTALVRGEMNAEITVDGKKKQLRNKMLAVWINESQGWKLLAYQPTPVIQIS